MFRAMGEFFLRRLNYRTCSISMPAATDNLELAGLAPRPDALRQALRQHWASLTGLTLPTRAMGYWYSRQRFQSHENLTSRMNRPIKIIFKIEIQFNLKAAS